MRAPYQVLVVPYRVRRDVLELLILRREDLNVWQWVAGGGEADESPRQAAQRELEEELGVTSQVFALQAQTRIPVVDVVGDVRWGQEHLVLTEYAFCADITHEVARLSAEHTEMRWLQLAESRTALAWDSNRSAAWEVAIRHEHGWWAQDEH